METIFFSIVNCGVPEPPVNGILGNYSHTEGGGIALFWCRDGFLPEGVRTSVCNYHGMWDPPLNCTGDLSKEVYLIADCEPGGCLQSEVLDSKSLLGM